MPQGKNCHETIVQLLTVGAILRQARKSSSCGGEAMWEVQEGGTRLVVFPRPNRSSWDPCHLPFPKKVQEGRGSRPEGGSRLEKGQGSRLVVFFGLYGVKKRGNTTSRDPPTSRDPSPLPRASVF